MAGGAGFVSDMIKSIRNNKNLRNNPYYKGENYNAKDPTTLMVDHRAATPEVHQKIRLKAKAEEVANRKRAAVAFIASLVILSIITFLLLAMFNNHN
jgi:hypothetical protein